MKRRDAIIEELHRVREDIGKAHDFDVRRIAATIRQHEAENPIRDETPSLSLGRSFPTVSREAHRRSRVGSGSESRTLPRPPQSTASLAAYANPNRTNLLGYNFDDKTTTQLTHFSGTTIGDFAWSRDGRHLAITRAQPMVEVVLFSGRR